MLRSSPGEISRDDSQFRSQSRHKIRMVHRPTRFVPTVLHNKNELVRVTLNHKHKLPLLKPVVLLKSCLRNVIVPCDLDEVTIKVCEKEVQLNNENHIHNDFQLINQDRNDGLNNHGIHQNDIFTSYSETSETPTKILSGYFSDNDSFNHDHQSFFDETSKSDDHHDFVTIKDSDDEYDIEELEKRWCCDRDECFGVDCFEGAVGDSEVKADDEWLLI